MKRSGARTILNRLTWGSFALAQVAGALAILHARDWRFADHLGVSSMVLLGGALAFALADWALSTRRGHGVSGDDERAI